MSKRKSAWRIWAYALGQKEGRSNKEADRIAFIRTLIMVQLMITNGFIIAGNIRHWNDNHGPTFQDPQCESTNRKRN